MKLIRSEVVKNDRMIVFHVDNFKRLDGQVALKYLFKLLKQTNKFVQFCENKVILVIAEYEDGSQVSYHHNVLINNLTTFDMYWNKIKG